VIAVSPKDAPFGLPVRSIYVTNTLVDCNSLTKVLALEIGTKGEGLLAWRAARPIAAAVRMGTRARSESKQAQK
jgi:hypothetical protein